MSNSELNTFLLSLRDAINKDSNQFNRAKTDSMYDAFRPQVNALLNDMYQEVKTNAETECQSLDYDTKKMEKWINSKYVSSDDAQKYSGVMDDIFTAKEKMKNQNYVSYLSSGNILHEATKNVNEIQISIKNSFDSMDSQIKYTQPLLNKKYGELNELVKIKGNRRSSEIVSTWALLLIIYSVYLIPGEGVHSSLALVILFFGSLLFGKLIKLEYRNASYLQTLIPGFIFIIIFVIVFGIIEYIIGHDYSDFLMAPFFIMWPFILPDKEIDSKINDLKKETTGLKENVNYLIEGISIEMNR